MSVLERNLEVADSTQDAGRDWGQEEKGRTENEIVEWHHRVSEDGFR